MRTIFNFMRELTWVFYIATYLAEAIQMVCSIHPSHKKQIRLIRRRFLDTKVGSRDLIESQTQRYSISFCISDKVSLKKAVKSKPLKWPRSGVKPERYFKINIQTVNQMGRKYVLISIEDKPRKLYSMDICKVYRLLKRKTPPIPGFSVQVETDVGENDFSDA